MAHKTIILERHDLVAIKSNKALQEITLNDFDSTRISREEIMRASLIIFVDNDTKVVKLKERAATITHEITYAINQLKR